MRIEQLLEGGSHLIDIAKRDNDPSALIVARWLHKHGGVSNSTSVEPVTISDAVNLMNSNSYATITAAFFFKGTLGYAGLYWLDHAKNPAIVVSRDGVPITKPDRTGPALRRFIATSIGDLVAVYQLESNTDNRRFPKNLRHLSPIDANYQQQKMIKNRPGMLLPGQRSVAERMWILSPRLFAALRRYIHQCLDSGEYQLSGTKDEVLDFFEEIINMKGNIEELYESHLLTWYYNYRVERLGGDDANSIDEDVFLYDWDDIVASAMHHANLRLPRPATARSGDIQPPPDFIKKLSPFLLDDAKKWAKDTFLNRVWRSKTGS